MASKEKGRLWQTKGLNSKIFKRVWEVLWLHESAPPPPPPSPNQKGNNPDSGTRLQTLLGSTRGGSKSVALGKKKGLLATFVLGLMENV